MTSEDMSLEQMLDEEWGTAFGDIVRALRAEVAALREELKLARRASELRMDFLEGARRERDEARERLKKAERDWEQGADDVDRELAEARGLLERWLGWYGPGDPRTPPFNDTRAFLDPRRAACEHGVPRGDQCFGCADLARDEAPRRADVPDEEVGIIDGVCGEPECGCAARDEARRCDECGSVAEHRHSCPASDEARRFDGRCAFCGADCYDGKGCRNSDCDGGP